MVKNVKIYGDSDGDGDENNRINILKTVVVNVMIYGDENSQVKEY